MFKRLAFLSTVSLLFFNRKRLFCYLRVFKMRFCVRLTKRICTRSQAQWISAHITSPLAIRQFYSAFSCTYILFFIRSIHTTAHTESDDNMRIRTLNNNGIQSVWSKTGLLVNRIKNKCFSYNASLFPLILFASIQKVCFAFSYRHHTYYLCSHHFCWSNVTTLTWKGTYHSNCPSHYHTNEHVVGSHICSGTVGTWKSSCCSNLDNSTQFAKGQQSQ